MDLLLRMMTCLLVATSAPAYATDAGASNRGRGDYELKESLRIFMDAVVGNSTGSSWGARELSTRWPFQDEVGEVCSWPGLSCSRGIIIKLELQDLGLQGSLKNTVDALRAPAFSFLQLL